MMLRRMRSTEAASSYLRRQARGARDLVGPFASGAVTALQEEAATLPARCDLFTAALRGMPAVAASIRDLRRAVRRGEAAAALQRADTPEARVAVAKTFISLRESGMVDEHLVAAALLQLIDGRSPIVEAAILCAAGPAAASPLAREAQTPTTVTATA